MIRARQHNEEPNLVWYESLNSEQETRLKGGRITDVVYDRGIATFNGVSSNITYPNGSAGVAGLTGLTMRFRNILFTDETKIILETSPDYNSNDGAFNFWVSAGSPASGWSGGGGRDAARTTATYIGQTLNVIVVLDTTLAGSTNTNTIYINGVAVPLTSVVNTAGLNAIFRSYAIYLGSRGNSSLFYTGNIDKIEIWNYAMSAAEVSNL